MIIDTTYLLPLSRIGIDTDLLGAIAGGKLAISLDNLGINSISLFELQAKAAKLKVPPGLTAEAIGVAGIMFRVEPFHEGKIVQTAYSLLERIPDYIDCIIVATAAALNEDLLTEDSKIHKNKDWIKREYGIKVLSYKDLVGS